MMEILKVFTKRTEWKHVAGAAIGGYVGAGLGVSAAGMQIAVSMTAPLSYPVCGFIGGAISNPKNPGDSAIKNAVMGSLAVPLAPIHLMTIPFTVVATTWGGIAAGVIAAEVITKDM